METYVETYMETCVDEGIIREADDFLFAAPVGCCYMVGPQMVGSYRALLGP